MYHGLPVVGLVGLAVCSACALAPPAAAQTPPPAEPLAAEPGNQTSSSDIVVTARKREERLQDVPAAVSAFSGDDARANQLQDIRDLQAVVPNLSTFEARSNGTLTAFFRGIGQADVVLTSDPGIGIYFDGVYLTRPQGAVLKIFDLERVEVLKGPQGSLYGRNTIGGAINYVSRQPGDEIRGSFEGSIGELGTQQVKVSLSGPLIPGKLYASFGAGSFNRNPIQRRVLIGDRGWSEDVSAARASLLWRASDTLDITLAGDISRDNSRPKYLTTLVQSPLFVATRPDVTFVTSPDPDVVASEGDPSFYVRSEGASLRANWAASDAVDLKVIAAHRSLRYVDAVDLDGVAAEIFDFSGRYRQRQNSLELQGNYDDGGIFNAVAGVFYLTSTESGQLQNIIGQPLAPNVLRVQDRTRRIETIAGYASTTIEPVAALRVTLGARYGYEKGSYDNDLRDYLGLRSSFIFPFDPAGQPLVSTLSGGRSDSWTSFTPQASVDYRLTPDAMVYASYSQGFKAGGFNERLAGSQVALPYNPEKVTTYSGGFKTSWLDRRLTINGEYFYNDYTDLQVLTTQFFTVNGVPTLTAIVQNAGEAVTKGFELEARFRTSDNLSLFVNVGQLDAEYKRFSSIDPATGQPVNLAAITPYQYAPDWTAAGGFNATIPLGGVGSMRVSGNANYRASEFKGFTTAIEGNTIFNGSIGFLSSSERLSVSLDATNIFNKRVVTNGFEAIGFRLANFNLPRIVRATVRYEF